MASLAFGQSKRDARWVLGYFTGLPGNENTADYGGMYLTFENGEATLEQFDIFSSSPMGTANDKNGNLLFYSTGCTIFNRNMQVMENGNDINPNTYCQTDADSYTYIRSGGIVLPNPANDQLWYSFQYRFEDTPSGWPLIQQLYLTTVDMTGDGGLGQVTDKQNAIIEDSLTGMYSAVRHGNGRDWWVVVPRGTDRSFWRMQITPAGVQPPVLQTLPPPYTPFNFTYLVILDQPPYLDTVPALEYASEVNNGQADFSPDGRMYARIIPNFGDIEIYDFNRCTGLLRLRRVFPVPRSLYPPPPTDPQYTLPSACGLSFSPDSRYLYFSNTGGLYQLDLSDNTSDYMLIGTYTGFKNPFYTNFFQMHLAPDGKIYMATGNGTKYLHVIDHPNEAGMACGFRERGLELPRWNSWTINYFPNFNLYDDPYGGCDSLGINDPNYAGAPLFEEFKVFPNPASAGLIKVYVPPCESARVSVCSIDGKVLYEMKQVTGNVIYGVDCADWPAGVYVVTAYLDAQKPVSKSVLVMH